MSTDLLSFEHSSLLIFFFCAVNLFFLHKVVVLHRPLCYLWSEGGLFGILGRNSRSWKVWICCCGRGGGYFAFKNMSTFFSIPKTDFKRARINMSRSNRYSPYVGVHVGTIILPCDIDLSFDLLLENFNLGYYLLNVGCLPASVVVFWQILLAYLSAFLKIIVCQLYPNERFKAHFDLLFSIP